MLETGDFGGEAQRAGIRKFFGVENGFRSCKHLEQVFGGKRANLEAQAALLTPDTKKALFGVLRFQRFLHQKRSGDKDR